MWLVFSLVESAYGPRTRKSGKNLIFFPIFEWSYHICLFYIGVKNENVKSRMDEPHDSDSPKPSVPGSPPDQSKKEEREGSKTKLEKDAAAPEEDQLQADPEAEEEEEQKNHPPPSVLPSNPPRPTGPSPTIEVLPANPHIVNPSITPATLPANPITPVTDPPDYQVNFNPETPVVSQTDDCHPDGDGPEVAFNDAPSSSTFNKDPASSNSQPQGDDPQQQQEQQQQNVMKSESAQKFLQSLNSLAGSQRSSNAKQKVKKRSKNRQGSSGSINGISAGLGLGEAPVVEEENRRQFRNGSHRKGSHHGRSKPSRKTGGNGGGNSPSQGSSSFRRGNNADNSKAQIVRGPGNPERGRQQQQLLVGQTGSMRAGRNNQPQKKTIVRSNAQNGIFRNGQNIRNGFSGGQPDLNQMKTINMAQAVGNAGQIGQGGGMLVQAGGQPQAREQPMSDGQQPQRTATKGQDAIPPSEPQPPPPALTNQPSGKNVFRTRIRPRGGQSV